MTARRAVFLDRDGVLNHARIVGGKTYPPETVEEFELLDGVAEACEKLKAAGFLLIVVTNQPDVATGKQARDVVDAMHAKLCRLAPIDDIFTCFHVDADGCDCRKPKPGMLIDAAEKHRIDLSRSYLVGDRWRDVEAGQAAGCKSFFIDYGYAERRPTGEFRIVASLLEASETICGEG